MDSSKDFKTMVAEYERALIEAALQEASGHQRRAAASLGILPTTLHEKMKRLGLRRPVDHTAA
jgi:DNA-binding NtrC family response regulator